MSAKQIPDEDRAKQYAFRVLGYRQRSEQEMRQRLERKGYPAAVVDRTLKELFRLGLLDDREFARCWISAHPGRGPALLKQELRQKGIDRDLAEELITTGIPLESELSAAWDVAVRATRHRTASLDQPELLRIRRLLQRRGFSYEVISRVCARLHSNLTLEGDWLE